jgi:hypothetical protein
MAKTSPTIRAGALRPLSVSVMVSPMWVPVAVRKPDGATASPAPWNQDPASIRYEPQDDSP